MSTKKQPSIDTEDLSAFFRGTITRVTYQSEESGFGVFRALPEGAKSSSGKEELTTVVGVLPSTLGAGTHIIARGEWQTHPKFGRQFRARSVTETAPTSPDAIERYLGSGVVKGFGPALAERVVAAFQEETLDIIDTEPDRLLEIQGIGQKKLQEIKTAWEEKQNIREVLLFFQGYGISLALAQRIHSTYKERSIEIVKKNPYVLARDVWGIGFHTADHIAQALGLDPHAQERLMAGVAYTVKRASDDGHCYLPREQLLAKASSLLQVEDEELLTTALERANLEGFVACEKDRVYLPTLLQAEKELASSIVSRLDEKPELMKKIPDYLVRSAGERAVITPGTEQSSEAAPSVLRLSEEQRQAIELVSKHSLVVITGGPGCGKTTVLKTVASLFRQAGLQVRLAAPTGRAAQRLAEVCEMEASTIHRMLRFDPIKRSFLHNEEDPLPVDALIVDESSMIDVPLAAHLLRAVQRETRIVFVGDADQLPSVGPGLFLGDLLQIKELPRACLTKLFRQKNESSITHTAHGINAGIVPDIPEPDGMIKSDSYFLPIQDPKEGAELIEKVVVEQIPKKFGLSNSDITVLSPMNKGELGIVNLNQKLQERLVPKTPGLATVQVGNIEYRLGDRVCQRVNNYNLHTNGVFNGDQGEITGIDSSAQKLYVRLWDGREIEYTRDVLYQLDLAYALTIHRAQGSEVPAIVLALHETHNILLERQLIYTAVTRAKRLLIVVGTRKALILATKRSRSKRRFTGLPERVLEIHS